MKKPTSKYALAVGQVWQMSGHFVKISGLGKSLVEYKLMHKPDQKAVQSQMGSFKNVESYLKTGKAKLIK